MCSATSAALGAVAAAAALLFWSWLAEVRADVSWRAFWLPVRDMTMHGRPWLKVHVWAHLAGGAVLALFLLGPWLAPGWAGHVWQRVLWLALFQGLWERVQHENWKEGAGSSAYPWWSAAWDWLITLAGWAAVELGRLLWRANL